MAASLVIAHTPEIFKTVIRSICEPVIRQKRRKSMAKPVLIIKTLEDSPPSLDRRLVSAYLQTTYRLIGFDIDIFIGPASADFLGWAERQSVTSFAILTAVNPASHLLTDQENAARNHFLECHLQTAGLTYVPAIALAAEGNWPPEPGFGIYNPSASRIVGLARLFDQNALVYWQTGADTALWWIA